MTVMEEETTSHLTLAVALDQLNQDVFLDGLRLDNLLTREQWSNTLGIHRSTMHRWESEIIDKVSPIKATYFSIKRMRAPYRNHI